MLTAKALEVAIAARQPGQELELDVGGCDGLKLRVKASGAASWTLRYRTAEGQKRVTLGRYPLMQLAAARNEGRKAKGRVAGGEDPSAKRHEQIAARRTMTFGALAQMWTSGDLAGEYPDHVKAKRSAKADVSRLHNHVLRHVGKVPLAAFELRHAEQVMNALPAGMKRGTRRQVAQVMARVLALAVYPLKVIGQTPIPRGWLPRPGATMAKTYLRPSEEAQLLGCVAVPLPLRVLYGVLAREGMRASEALSLEWSDIDLRHGSVVLEKNKTDHPREWALDPGTHEALKRWRRRGKGERVFGSLAKELGPEKAEQLREHLAEAGIKRPQLFEASAERVAFRMHDLRTGFVTLALADGRSESWVRRRTGHTSSQMIARYEVLAETAAELKLGWYKPMHEAIPEMRKATAKRDAKPANVIELAERRAR